MSTEPEPDIVLCENCDAEVVADLIVHRSNGDLWCSTCNDNELDLEDEEDL